MNFRSTLFVFVILLIFTSCATKDKLYMQSELEKSLVTGLVIDEKGLPLEGVTVSLNSFNKSFTDINGKFIYNYLVFGNHKLEFEKDGYTNNEVEFEFRMKNIRKKQPVFVKVKLFSFNYLLSETFEYYKEGNNIRVEEYLEKLANINPHDESYLYMKAIYYVGNKQYQQALVILEDLRVKDRDNLYYALSLIEVYQLLKYHEKEANLCYYTAQRFPDHSSLLERAAKIYRDQLNNMEKYEEITSELKHKINIK
ncbi:MAG: hypothetical protein MJB14_13275 [Spirochaetes bacterium]|nr:hypothetical protein [Spirochaetota bacterium]